MICLLQRCKCCDLFLFIGAQECDQHTKEWENCLYWCHATLKRAIDIFRGLGSDDVQLEVLEVEDGKAYLESKFTHSICCS